MKQWMKNEKMNMKLNIFGGTQFKNTLNHIFFHLLMYKKVGSGLRGVIHNIFIFFRII